MFKILSVLLISTLALSVSKVSAQDPMQPPNWATGITLPKKVNKVSTKSIRLQQILISKEKKLAVINGLIIAEGKSKQGIKLLKVNKSSVKIKTKKGTKTLKLLVVNGVKKS